MGLLGPTANLPWMQDKEDDRGREDGRGRGRSEDEPGDSKHTPGRDRGEGELADHISARD